MLLRLGVVLLGLKVVFGDVLALGLGGLVAVCTVVVTFGLTIKSRRHLCAPQELRVLIAAELSSCGAVAIAAV